MFPLDELAGLEGQALHGALDHRARSWNAENPGKLQQAREEDRRKLDAIESSIMSMPGASIHASRLRGDNARPVTFEEVAPLAAWALRPCGVVVSGPQRGALHPTQKVIFFAAWRRKDALQILEILRERVPRVPPGPFGTGHALLEYGVSASENEADAILAARALEDFQEGRRRPGWAVQLAEEAARALELLEQDRPARRDEDSSDRSTSKVPSAGEQAALNSYRWALTTRPDLDKQGERNYEQVYGYLKNEIAETRCPIYPSLRELPSFATWTRYVREAMKYETVRPDPDDDVGGSIVRQKDL